MNEKATYDAPIEDKPIDALTDSGTFEDLVDSNNDVSEVLAAVVKRCNSNPKINVAEKISKRFGWFSLLISGFCILIVVLMLFFSILDKSLPPITDLLETAACLIPVALCIAVALIKTPKEYVASTIWRLVYKSLLFILSLFVAYLAIGLNILLLATVIIYFFIIIIGQKAFGLARAGIGLVKKCADTGVKNLTIFCGGEKIAVERCYGFFKVMPDLKVWAYIGADEKLYIAEADIEEAVTQKFVEYRT